MNLHPPPKTGNTQLDRYLEDIYKFLQFPSFPRINLTPRATCDDTTEGNLYYDSDDDKLKVRTASAWEDAN